MKNIFLKTSAIVIGLTLLSQTPAHAVVTDQAFGNLSTAVGDLRGDLNQLDHDLNARVDGTAQNLADITGRVTVVEQAQGQAQLQQMIAALQARVAVLEGAAPPAPVPAQNPQDLQGFVGEIRYSLLSVADFQRIYGNSWQLLNGDVVHPTDELYQYLTPEARLNRHIPDARGRFLRCYNGGRDIETGNPEGDLAVGLSQNDKFEKHSHGVTDPGHAHRQLVTANPGHGKAIRADFNFDSPNPGQGCMGYDQGIDTVNACSNISIQPLGGKETRPRCVIVNAFVKIN
jgi:hypothetical protein